MKVILPMDLLRLTTAYSHRRFRFSYALVEVNPRITVPGLGLRHMGYDKYTTGDCRMKQKTVRDKVRRHLLGDSRDSL